MSSDSEEEVLYSVNGKIATITLNRPDRLNAISPTLPFSLKRAVETANADNDVRVIVLTGAGRAFCAGYDLIEFAQNSQRGERGNQALAKGYDPYKDYVFMGAATEAFMSLFYSLKPTIAKINGFAVAGGSDIALCCDLVVMADEAKIGYPPARVWGSPTTAMWVHRLGPEKAKRMLFTGDLISGQEAKEMGLVLEAVPRERLDETVEKLAHRICTVPTNQLFFQKQAVEENIRGTQRLAVVFDGLTRHSPEGVAFQQRAMQKGFKQAVKERDDGSVDWTELAHSSSDPKTRVWESSDSKPRKGKATEAALKSKL